MSKNNQRKLILVTGTPASGKTTIIHKLSKKINFTYIKVDDIKNGIYGGKRRDSIEYLTLKDKVKDITNNIIKTNLNLNQIVIVENTFWDEVINLNWYKRFYDIVEDKYIYIIRCIVSSKDELFKRLLNRNFNRDLNKTKSFNHFSKWLKKEPIKIKMSKGITINTEEIIDYNKITKYIEGQ